MSKIEPTLVAKPWGREIIWGDIKGKCTGKNIWINRGHRLSRQYHEQKEEVIHVIRGNIRLEIGENSEGSPEEVYIGGPGFSYHISPGTIHRFCAPFNDCELVEISTYFPDDVVRIKDDYNR